jgi:short-subunit dehydrogenase
VGGGGSVSIPPPQADSIALVTGASSGIGEQFARQLAARSYRVAIVARRRERLERLAEELGGQERAVPIEADLAVAEDRDRLAERIEQLGANVEVLVNNAGVGVYAPFVESAREQELRQLRVDVEAVVDLMARYLPGMVRRARGAVINMSSTAGFQPLPYNAGYAAAKGHVLLLSEAVNEEVKESGVSVTAVCPGPVPTEFQATNDAGYFADKLPKITFVSAERVARDALAAADRGRRSVIPGGLQVRATFAPNRLAPSRLSVPIAKRIMARR